MKLKKDTLAILSIYCFPSAVQLFHSPPHGLILSHKIFIMEDILRVTVASSLGRSAGDDNPDIVSLASLDDVVQVPDTLVRQKSVRGVIRPAIRVRVPVVPEDPDQANQVGRGQLRLKVETIVALEITRPPVDSVESDWLARSRVDQVRSVNPQPGRFSHPFSFNPSRSGEGGVD